MTWHCGIVPRAHLEALWPVVAPLLQPAIDRTDGRISADTVRQSLESTHTLWIISDGDHIAAAMTTRVAEYPLKKMLVVECIGGSQLKQWQPVAIKALTGYAKDNALNGIEMYGRPGWAKSLSAYGWRQTMVLCEVNIVQEPMDV